ncbi:hypothetical protein T4D_16071 [Trichinella pseudospiralis]|uniref:Uncharacterized protein n=1 Tax=Trichinella pseudospiralis TaxID=6337 RepID=A0A0V1F6N4_TRIPS|nr:hypothetical protein T4D_7374 [Trichinella pseudospiralis]KRY83455.1 hypothetical protein T4D_16071 [Trichinella pseudospiralis]
MSPRPCKPSWSEPPFVSFCQLHYIHAQAQPVSRVVLPWAVSRTLVPPIVGSLQVDSGKMLSNDWLLTLPKLEQPRCHSNTRPSNLSNITRHYRSLPSPVQTAWEVPGTLRKAGLCCSLSPTVYQILPYG